MGVELDPELDYQFYLCTETVLLNFSEREPKDLDKSKEGPLHNGSNFYPISDEFWKRVMIQKGLGCKRNDPTGFTV